MLQQSTCRGRGATGRQRERSAARRWVADRCSRTAAAVVCCC
jgi:hypothetical protein